MCDCIGRANEALRKHGLCLITGMHIYKETKRWTTFLVIPTERRADADKKVKPLSFVPTYCPFCGEPMEQDIPTESQPHA